MVIAMFLAHLVGDFILQWDSLARWKSRALSGVLVHGFVVTLVTWLLSAFFDPAWWPWALLIGIVHTGIDVLPIALGARLRLSALTRLAVDQLLHVAVIVFALAASGYLSLPSLALDLVRVLHDNRVLAMVFGYAFISMPAWILVEFAVYGLIKGSAPDFSQTTNKYVGILERGLITTCVVLGQFALVPVVALPRLVFEGPQAAGRRGTALYVAEWLASLMLAVAVGLSLRQI